MNTSPEKPATTDAAPLSDSNAKRTRSGSHRGQVLLWLMAVLFLIAMAWATTSNNSFAQSFQQLAGLQHDSAVVDSPFSVAAHNFRYYKFVLPQGSRNVSIMGDFTAAPESGSAKHEGDDNNIEVYVLSEAAFPVWQNGYATNSVYQSGKVSRARIEADIPEGAGVYYIVFSNKFSPKTSKKINASLSLRYRGWLPRSWQQAGERFWDSLGL